MTQGSCPGNSSGDGHPVVFLSPSSSIIARIQVPPQGLTQFLQVLMVTLVHPMPMTSPHQKAPAISHRVCGGLHGELSFRGHRGSCLGQHQRGQRFQCCSKTTQCPLPVAVEITKSSAETEVDCTLFPGDFGDTSFAFYHLFSHSLFFPTWNRCACWPGLE